ncbi:MAG: prolyl oligopeptidase family serine peptidase [Gammaproteobacteria bacterium]
MNRERASLPAYRPPATRQRRLGAAAVTLLLCLGSAGCFSTRPLSAAYPGPAARTAELETRFAYRPLVGENTREVIGEKRHYTVEKVRLMPEDSTGDDASDPLVLEYYRVAGEGPRPAALVLPILAGKNRVARQFAGYFASHGLPSVIVYTRQKDNLLADLSDPEAAIRRAVARHRQALDWMSGLDEIDADRIGVFGASLGGFNALFLAAADPRVKAVVPALAGADLPRLLVASEERRIAKNVDKFRDERGWSDEQMEDYLRSAIASDPLELAGYIDARDALMIIARYDDSVPYLSQLQLRQALGEPEALVLTSGHVSSLLYLPYLKWKVLEFFRKHLDFS